MTSAKLSAYMQASFQFLSNQEMQGHGQLTSTIKVTHCTLQVHVHSDWMQAISACYMYLYIVCIFLGASTLYVYMYQAIAHSRMCIPTYYMQCTGKVGILTMYNRNVRELNAFITSLLHVPCVLWIGSFTHLSPSCMYLQIHRRTAIISALESVAQEQQHLTHYFLPRYRHLQKMH